MKIYINNLERNIKKKRLHYERIKMEKEEIRKKTIEQLKYVKYFNFILLVLYFLQRIVRTRKNNPRKKYYRATK